MKQALIVVDAQNDFMPGGALPVSHGDEIIPVVNRLLKEFELVVFTKDWHPKNSEGFASQHEGKRPFDSFINNEGMPDTLWPDHCVADTRGAEIHEDIRFENCKKDMYIFKKGTDQFGQGYSGFEKTGLADFLEEKGVTDVVVCGLATDYCVKNTAIDAKKEGFNVIVYLPACRAIAEYLHETLRELSEQNINIVPENDGNEAN